MSADNNRGGSKCDHNNSDLKIGRNNDLSFVEIFFVPGPILISKEMENLSKCNFFEIIASFLQRKSKEIKIWKLKESVLFWNMKQRIIARFQKVIY